jgi:predicted site-specific integrase-resolvase
MPARTLTKVPILINRPAARAIQVVLYARVSSKEQEKDGFSIPAQLRLLREYAAGKGFAIVHEFTDVETAKESGRTNFGQMLTYLQKHSSRQRELGHRPRVPVVGTVRSLTVPPASESSCLILTRPQR